jgi:hypothetical protein
MATHSGFRSGWGNREKQAHHRVKDEEDVQPTNLTAEMLGIHHQCGHISFARIQEMAKLGMIPKRLAKCLFLTCSACLYAKAIRQKWQSKETTNNRNEAT